jgi:hypothetical protein
MPESTPDEAIGCPRAAAVAECLLRARLSPALGTALAPQIGHVADNAEHDRRRGRTTKKARDPLGRIDGGCTNITHNKDSADYRAHCRSSPSHADAHYTYPKTPRASLGRGCGSEPPQPACQIQVERDAGK